jgi:spermidine/putrescine transport system ATP-binding protein
MQEFLKAIHREIKTTFLFVTHDQEEAIAMADRICVMNFGKILQLGSPTEVYYRPRSEFVARFFGDNNLIEGVLGRSEGSRRIVETPIGAVACAADDAPELLELPAGGKAFAMIRPEAISLGGDGAAAFGGHVVRGEVTSVSFGGASTVATVTTAEEAGSLSIRIRLPSHAEGSAISVGEHVQLGWKAGDCRLVPA